MPLSQHWTCKHCGRDALPGEEPEPWRDIWSRISPGDVLPAGDCPDCGEFVYYTEEPDPAAAQDAATTNQADAPNPDFNEYLLDTIARLIPSPRKTGGALYRYVCQKCGGETCGYDAYSTWDPLLQDWVLGGSYDDGWCSNCGDVEPKRVPITGAEALALEERRKTLARIMSLAMTIPKSIDGS